MDWKTIPCSRNARALIPLIRRFLCAVQDAQCKTEESPWHGKEIKIFKNCYRNSNHNSSILPSVRRKRVSLIYDFTLVYIVWIKYIFSCSRITFHAWVYKSQSSRLTFAYLDDNSASRFARFTAKKPRQVLRKNLRAVPFNWLKSIVGGKTWQKVKAANYVNTIDYLPPKVFIISIF